MSWFDKGKQMYRRWSGDPKKMKETSDKLKKANINEKELIVQSLDERRRFLTKRIIDSDKTFQLFDEYQ